MRVRVGWKPDEWGIEQRLAEGIYIWFYFNLSDDSRDKAISLYFLKRGPQTITVRTYWWSAVRHRFYTMKNAVPVTNA